MMKFLLEITYPRIDPVFISMGPFSVRWYGMAYLAAFFLGYWLLIKLARREVLRMPADWVSDLVGLLALGVIVGGRTGWWIFYHRTFSGPGIQPEPWYEPIAIWHGGMSFHGGLIGVMTVLLIWSINRKVSFLNLCDSLALVTPVGLFLGRIANFINDELIGRPTNVPWAMRFPIYSPDHKLLGFTEPRHPSQLYEALLEGPVLFAAVWIVLRWKNRRDGQIGAMFVVAYAIFRFLVEFTREPDEQFRVNGGNGTILLGMTMGQLLSLAIGVAGLVWFIWLHMKGSLAAQGTFARQDGFEASGDDGSQKDIKKSRKEMGKKAE